MGWIVLRFEQTERPKFVADRLDVLTRHPTSPSDGRNGCRSLAVNELENGSLGRGDSAVEVKFVNELDEPVVEETNLVDD
jgi:hypothetical protein